MLQQPRMLGLGLGSRQPVEVGQNVFIVRDVQRPANSLEVMHSHGQGAVHVKNPVLYILECHAQSLRWRIKPSCVTDATNLPARLKTLPREKPRELPAHGLSIA